MHSTGAAFWSYSSLRLKPDTTFASKSVLLHEFILQCTHVLKVTIFITIVNFLKSQGWTSCGCTAGDPSVSETSSNEQGQDSGRAGPNYRQCRPAPVSSHQGSGRAGPEESVCITHSRIAWCAQTELYMLSVEKCSLRDSPSYRKCRPAPVSSRQDSGRAGPEKSVLHKHTRWNIWYGHTEL